MKIVRRIYYWIRLKFSGTPKYVCPCCGYRGRFLDVDREYGRRFSAKCPRCDALERHRLQALVLEKLDLKGDIRVLHFAPEGFFRKRLSAVAGRYETADIERPDVDHRVDIQALPFESESFDLVYASHVMEHVENEAKGLSEVARILRPGGIAILPVPIVREVTEEYDAPRPEECMHWRAPGKDYFDRLRAVFSEVGVFTSAQFGDCYQTWVLEPDKRTMDYVPVCRKLGGQLG